MWLQFQLLHLACLFLLDWRAPYCKKYLPSVDTCRLQWSFGLVKQTKQVWCLTRKTGFPDSTWFIFYFIFKIFLSSFANPFKVLTIFLKYRHHNVYVPVMDSLIPYAGQFHLPTSACYSPPNTRRDHVCPLSHCVAFKFLPVMKTVLFQWLLARLWSHIMSTSCIPAWTCICLC